MSCTWPGLCVAMFFAEVQGLLLGWSFRTFLHGIHFFWGVGALELIKIWVGCNLNYCGGISEVSAHCSSLFLLEIEKVYFAYFCLSLCPSVAVNAFQHLYLANVVWFSWFSSIFFPLGQMVDLADKEFLFFIFISFLSPHFRLQIEPIPSGNLPPGFDPSTCRSVWVSFRAFCSCFLFFFVACGA